MGPLKTSGAEREGERKGKRLKEKEKPHQRWERGKRRPSIISRRNNDEVYKERRGRGTQIDDWWAELDKKRLAAPTPRQTTSNKRRRSIYRATREEDIKAE